MVKEFHARNRYVSFTKNQVQEKECQLKRDYKMLKAARQQSGSTWNERRCMVEGSSSMWDNLQVTYPKIKKFRSNRASFPLFDRLGELYDGHLAEGTYNCTSLGSGEEEEPLRLIQELEDDPEEQDDVFIIEDQDASTSRVQQAEVANEDPRAVSEAQRRHELIAAKRQEKEDKKNKKTSVAENMMVRYLDLRAKEMEKEAKEMENLRAKEMEKESKEMENLQGRNQAQADYSVKRCVYMLSQMDVTKEEKAKAYTVSKNPDDREVFLCACEDDPEAALIWLRGEMAKA